MKQLLITLLVTLSTPLIFAQQDGKTEKPHRFGVAVNSSIDGIVGEICTAPTGTIYLNKHQIELGLCLYPFNFVTPRMVGGNLEYKYFPNGLGNRFSLYFHAHLNYTYEFIDHQYIVSNYQTTYNYLGLMGGYGFQVRFLKNAYIGTNLNFGFSTSSRFSSEIQYPYNRPLFENYEMNGAVRLNIGYRF